MTHRDTIDLLPPPLSPPSPCTILRRRTVPCATLDSLYSGILSCVALLLLPRYRASVQTYRFDKASPRKKRETIYLSRHRYSPRGSIASRSSHVIKVVASPNKLINSTPVAVGLNIARLPRFTTKKWILFHQISLLWLLSYWAQICHCDGFFVIFLFLVLYANSCNFSSVECS